jgi:hypothetical protein
MIITNAKYFSDIDANETPSIEATINDKVVFIPPDPANRHYQEVMALVEAGELTIEPAD